MEKADEKRRCLFINSLVLFLFAENPKLKIGELYKILTGKQKGKTKNNLDNTSLKVNFNA